MDLEIVDPFKAAGVPEHKARAVVESLDREIDQRFTLHAAQLATRADLAEGLGGIKLAISQFEAKFVTATSSAIAHLDSETASAIAAFKVDLIKWFVGSTITMTAVLLAAIRLFPR